ncbi:hypothetical protein QZH41_018424 [Actinostola sp. cb2023]|nr:hypothetical protein QZH41_018424 [Actinostola sp. cb2023]
MKSSIAVILLFVVQIYAEDVLSEYMLDDSVVDPDRHPYVQCKIDFYDCLRLGKKKQTQCLLEYKNCITVLVPSVPPKVSKCNAELKTCLAGASGLWEKAKCFASYGKCLLPKPHPYFQCKIDLTTCFRDGKTGKLQCMLNYTKCMAQFLPSLPPYLSKCNSVLMTCINDAGDYLDVSQCSIDYGRCVEKGRR